MDVYSNGLHEVTYVGHRVKRLAHCTPYATLSPARVCVCVCVCVCVSFSRYTVTHTLPDCSLSSPWQHHTYSETYICLQSAVLYTFLFVSDFYQSCVICSCLCVCV